MNTAGETYLGDGLYASFDGYHFILRAPRDGIDHWVGLEPAVLREFMVFVERTKSQLAEEAKEQRGER